MSTRRGLVFSLAIATALAASSASPTPARADTELKVCGVVAVYIPATALLPGALTVGATPFLVAAGTTLGSSVTVGANLCFDLTLGLGGGITGATVVANVSSTPSVCGSVTAFTAATITAAGALTINGVTFVVAVGTALPAVVSVGADLCLHLTLNGHGQVAGATAQANATSTLNICGAVAAFAAAGSISAGTLTIAGQTLVIAAGTAMPASVNSGADMCLRLTLNGLGQVSAAAVHANLVSTLEVCGQVTSYAAATATGDGTLAISGATYTIVTGTSLPSSVQVNAYLRLSLTLDTFARVTGAAVLGAGASLADACGSNTVPTPEPDPDLLPGVSASSPPDVSDPRVHGVSPAPIDAAISDGAPRHVPPGNGDVEPGQGQEVPGPDEATVTDAATPPDPGQILPDTASFGRAGRALLQVSLPLLLLLLGLLGREVVLHRRRPAIAAQDSAGGAP